MYSYPVTEWMVTSTIYALCTSMGGVGDSVDRSTTSCMGTKLFQLGGSFLDISQQSVWCKQMLNKWIKNKNLVNRKWIKTAYCPWKSFSRCANSHINKASVPCPGWDQWRSHVTVNLQNFVCFHKWPVINKYLTQVHYRNVQPLDMNRSVFAFFPSALCHQPRYIRWDAIASSVTVASTGIWAQSVCGRQLIWNYAFKSQMVCDSMFIVE